MLRRFLLVLSSGLVCSTVFLGESRAKTGSSTEVEVAGATGQSAGGWICGPSGAVRYGGLAVQVRHSERRPSRDDGLGTTLVAGAAVEGQFLEQKEDSDDSASWPQTRFFSGPLVAAHTRVGYHFQYIGLEAGGMLFSGRDQWREAQVAGFPIAEVSLGRRDLFYFVAGVGPSQLTNQFAFGFPYAGFGLPLGKASLNLRASVDIGVGFVRTPPRVDTFWTVPMNDSWSLRGGFALGGGLLAPSHEASLGFTFRN